MIRHTGKSNRTQKYGVGIPQLLYTVFRHHVSGVAISLTRPIVLSPIKLHAIPGAGNFQGLNTFGYYLFPNTITGYHRNLYRFIQCMFPI